MLCGLLCVLCVVLWCVCHLDLGRVSLELRVNPTFPSSMLLREASKPAIRRSQYSVPA